MKKLLRFFMVFASVYILTSCIKSDEQVSGIGDAIIVSKVIDGNTKYSVSLYAYTFSEFKTVTAVGALNMAKTYTLGPNQGYKTSFYYEAPDQEFSATPPSADTYTFNAIFENGQQEVFQDVLTDKVLPIPNIKKVEYKSDDNSMTVSWDELSSAEGYAINLSDESNNVVYATNILGKALTSYDIISSGTGWASSSGAINGKTYRLQLYAFDYEAEPSSYDVQATSIVGKTIIWSVNPAQ